MTDHRDFDPDRRDFDPELRELLDSVGLVAEERLDDGEHDPEETARAEALLGRILATEREEPTVPKRSPRLGLWGSVPHRLVWPGAMAVAALCLAMVVIVVVSPWSGQQPAMAATPPMLSFADARSGQLPVSGEPAGQSLGSLSTLASEQPASGSGPVQRTVLEAWWAATDLDAEGAHTVVIPSREEIYQLPDGTQRTISRRGHPLDADGHLTDAQGSWSQVPAEGDDTFENDQGTDYPQKLPEDLTELRGVVAPSADCAATEGGCMIEFVSNLYSNYVVDPSVSARLWQLLATEPSITSLGHTKDRLGRPALAFTAQASDPRQQDVLLLDPNTGSFLGAETIQVRDGETLGVEPPAVVSFTALVEASRIDAKAVPGSRTTKRY